MKSYQVQLSDTPYNEAAPDAFIGVTAPFYIAVKMSLSRDQDGVFITPKKISEIDYWCTRVFGPGNYRIFITALCLWVFLKDDESLMRFKLRWL